MKHLSSKRLMDLHVNGALVYEVAFIYYLVITFLQTSTYNDFFSLNAFHYASLISLGLILFKLFFLDEQKVTTFIFNLVCLGFLVFTWRTSQNFSLLPLGFFIIGARNVDFRKLIKLYFVIGVTLLIFVMLSSSMGLIKNLVYHRVQTNTLRQSFGTVYPTDFAAHVLYLILAYVYLKFEKVSWIDYILFIVIAYLLIVFCDARLNSIAILLIIPVTWIGKRARQDKIISKFIASLYWIIPTVFCLLSLILTVFYTNNSIFRKINQVTSGRLVLSHTAYRKYGFSLFGTKVVEHGWGGTKGLNLFKDDPGKYFFIDSSYVRIIVFFGIIALFLVVLTMTIISWRSMHYEVFALASIMVIVSISAIVEQRLIDLSYDPFLLALFATTNYLKTEEKIP